VTSPEELTEATETLEEDQEMSFLVALAGETVALSCSVSPIVISFEAGLTDTDCIRTSGFISGEGLSFLVHENRNGRIKRRSITSLFISLSEWLICKYSNY
jgi:hypothetical protein